MANTFNNTINKVGDAIEAVMGGAKKSTPYNDPNHVYTGQTCLERFGMEARNAHLLRNEWRKDLAYSKPLVDAEYMIQTEFKVSSYEDRLNEQAQESAEKAARKADKQAEKKAKKAAKDTEKAEKTKAKEERKQRKEMIKDTEKYMHLSNPMDNLANFNLSQWK